MQCAAHTATEYLSCTCAGEQRMPLYRKTHVCIVKSCARAAANGMRLHGNCKRVLLHWQASKLEAAVEAALLPRDAVDEREVVLEVAPSSSLARLWVHRPGSIA